MVFFPLFEVLLVKKGIDTYTPQPKRPTNEEVDISFLLIGIFQKSKHFNPKFSIVLIRYFTGKQLVQSILDL